MAKVLIAIGSNLGDRRATIDHAAKALDGCPNIRILKKSRLYTSQPAGGPAGQGAYLNGAVLVETTLLPEQLLRALQKIENSLGRKRDRRWDARTVDLDLLLYDDAVIETESLIVPHLRMSFRVFVLKPVAEIAPEMRHPVIGWTLAELLRHIDSDDRYLAIVGSDHNEAARFASALCERLGYSLVFKSAAVSPDLPLVAFGDRAGRGKSPTIESSNVRPMLAVVLDKQSEPRSPNGPMLRLYDMAFDMMVDEVAAAVAAMTPVHIATG